MFLVYTCSFLYLHNPFNYHFGLALIHLTLSLQVLLCSPLLATYAYRFLITYVCFQKLELVQFPSCIPAKPTLILKLETLFTLYALNTPEILFMCTLGLYTSSLFQPSSPLLFVSFSHNNRKRNGKELIAKRLKGSVCTILGYIHFMFVFFCLFVFFSSCPFLQSSHKLTLAHPLTPPPNPLNCFNSTLTLVTPVERGCTR